MKDVFGSYALDVAVAVAAETLENQVSSLGSPSAPGPAQSTGTHRGRRLDRSCLSFLRAPAENPCIAFHAQRVPTTPHRPVRICQIPVT